MFSTPTINSPENQANLARTFWVTKVRMEHGA